MRHDGDVAIGVGIGRSTSNPRSVLSAGTSSQQNPTDLTTIQLAYESSVSGLHSKLNG